MIPNKGPVTKLQKRLTHEVDESIKVQQHEINRIKENFWTKGRETYTVNQQIKEELEYRELYPVPDPSEPMINDDFANKRAKPIMRPGKKKSNKQKRRDA